MTTLPAISEKSFQAQVVDLARLNGWLVYHTYDSRRSESGFPDLVMVRGPELIFVEIKNQAGKLSLTQRSWIDALSKVGAAVAAIESDREVTHVGVYLWRPDAWDEIVTLLSRRHPERGSA